MKPSQSHAIVLVSAFALILATMFGQGGFGSQPAGDTQAGLIVMDPAATETVEATDPSVQETTSTETPADIAPETDAAAEPTAVPVTPTETAAPTSADPPSQAPDDRPGRGEGNGPPDSSTTEQGLPVARYIVRLQPGASREDVERDRVNTQGGRVEQRFNSIINGFTVELPEHAVEALQRDSRVMAVMPDFVVSISAQTTPKGIERVGATANALAKIDGVDERVDVDVAVLDTGVDPHPDLNIVGGVDCTGNGSYADPHGHGTHVAGTIGALDNGIGVVGVAPGARIWSVRVLAADGSGLSSWILCGIDWVTQQGGTIDIANMSLGGTGKPDDNNCGFTNGDILHQAICASVNQGVTYVVAAGNSNVDSASQFPASYDEVITVSALVDTDGKPGGLGSATSVGADDTMASFSNYGADVDVIAPGVSIYSTARGGGYTYMSGTSMASPHVAGAAALYHVANPTATPANIRSGLISSGSVNAWSNDKDAFKEALIDVTGFAKTQTVDRRVVSVTAPASASQGTTATVSAVVGNAGSASETMSVTLAESPNGFSQTQSVTVAAGGTGTVNFTWNVSTATAAGAHTLTVSVPTTNDSNPANNSATATTNVQASATAPGMSISNLTLTSATVSGGYRLTSLAYLKSNGANVSGAAVTVDFTLPNGSKQTQTATTNTSGYASFYLTVTATGTYTVTVTNVVKSGLTYNAGGNVVSSKSVTIGSTGGGGGTTGMSVSNMTLSSTTVSGGYRLLARVYVKANGANVSGASVTVEFAQPDGSKPTQTATTNTYGYATFYRTVSAGGTYTVTVTNVVKSGYSYNAGGNVVSSKSVTIGSSGGGGGGGTTSMSVSNMTLTSTATSGGYTLSGKVYVKAGTSVVSGASVSVQWTNPNATTSTATATTNTSGYATFNRSVTAQGSYVLAVTNVVKSGLTYNAAGNVVSVKSVSVGSGGGGGTGSEASCLNAEEAAFLQLINNYRASKGLAALKATKTLNTAAYTHSLDMGTRAYFAHDTKLPLPAGQSGPKFTDRMSAAGYTYSTYKGENIAAGYATASAVFNAWKGSSGHNANMLNANFKAIGIGFATVSGSPYTNYWTTNFGGVVDAAPACS